MVTPPCGPNGREPQALLQPWLSLSLALSALCCLEEDPGTWGRRAFPGAFSEGWDLVGLKNSPQ